MPPPMDGKSEEQLQIQNFWEATTGQGRWPVPKLAPETNQRLKTKPVADLRSRAVWNSQLALQEPEFVRQQQLKFRSNADVAGSA